MNSAQPLSSGISSGSIQPAVVRTERLQPTRTFHSGLCSGIAAAVMFLAAVSPPHCSGQELNSEPWPGELSPTIKLFVGWDFSGMTEEEVNAFNGITNPLSEEEIQRALTPEELAVRQKVALAVLQPEEFARRYPVLRTPDQVANAEFEKWAMSNPEEARIIARQQRTVEQLEQDDLSLWFVTHPNEALQLADKITPEQREAQLRAVLEVTHPILKPNPVFELVPFGGAAGALDDENHN